MESSTGTVHGIIWTHWYEECPNCASKCVVIKTSYSWWRILMGTTHKCLFDDGETMWVNHKQLIERS